MDDDPARSADPSKQTRELENEIRRIRREIQTSDNRQRLRLLANELNRAFLRMDDLDVELRDFDRPVPLFFQL
jgi:hypothetical protein